MTRVTLALCAAPLLIAGACNVTKDPANDSTTVSVDQNKIENAGDALLSETAKMTETAANKIENAGPELENSAATIKERAGRVADKAEALGNRVETRVDADKPAENQAHANH